MKSSLGFFDGTKDPDDKNLKKYCFFIPLFEQIKPANYNFSHTWSFIRQANVRRKFYKNEEHLYRSELSGLSQNQTLSCYKVMLTDAEFEQLKPVQQEPNLYKAALNFQPDEITSLIVFSTNGSQEHKNPLQKAAHLAYVSTF